MRVLLTGAGGRLGRALAGALREHDVHALEHASLDIADLEAVRRLMHSRSPDVVVNAAAWTDVDGAEEHPVATYRANALGPRNLAIATSEAGAALLHFSTDYVFDGRASRPYHEFDAAGPISTYAASKLAGEEEVRRFNPRHYIARTAWLYAAGGPSFPRTMLALASQACVRAVCDQFGSPTYAPHLASAAVRLIETRAWGTYHLAGRGGTTWYELARRLFALLSIETPVVPAASAEFPRPAARPRYSVLTTIQEPEILLPPWEDGIEEFARTAARAP